MHDITPSLGQCGENRHLPSMNQSVKAGVHGLIVVYTIWPITHFPLESPMHRPRYVALFSMHAIRPLMK